MLAGWHPKIPHETFTTVYAMGMVSGFCVQPQGSLGTNGKVTAATVSLFATAAQSRRHLLTEQETQIAGRSRPSLPFPEPSETLCEVDRSGCANPSRPQPGPG